MNRLCWAYIKKNGAQAVWRPLNKNIKNHASQCWKSQQSYFTTLSKTLKIPALHILGVLHLERLKEIHWGISRTNLHGITHVPFFAEVIGPQVFPGDEVVERLSGRLAPGDEGAALSADAQAGDVTGT